MNLVGKASWFRQCALLGLSLTVVAGGALLGGCRGNTTSAATVDHHAGKPPEVVARPTVGMTVEADPLTEPAWRNAAWKLLVAPSNSTHMPPPGRAAALYDAGNLYVAVICELPVGEEENRDVVALYLDPKGEGRELMQITTDVQGRTQANWIRSTTVIAPLEDGSPNKSYPLDLRPDFKIAGLASQVRHGREDGRPVWTVTLAVPVGGLPVMMRSAPGGAAWKFNVLRSFTAGGAGSQELLQSNVSPVYVNAQAFSPDRMAKLAFAGNETDLRVNSTPNP